MEVRSEQECEHSGEIPESHLYRGREIAFQEQIHNASHDKLLPSSFSFSYPLTESGSSFTNNNNEHDRSERQTNCEMCKFCNDVKCTNAQSEQECEKGLECQEEREYKHTEEQWERQISPLGDDRQSVNGMLEQCKHYPFLKKETKYSNAVHSNLQWSKPKSSTKNSDSTSYSKSRRVKRRSNQRKPKNKMPELEYELLLQTSFPSAYTSGYVIEEEEMSDDDDDNDDDVNTSKWTRGKSNTRNTTKRKSSKKHNRDNDSIEYSFEFQEDDSDSESDSDRETCTNTHFAKRNGKTTRHGRENSKLNSNRLQWSTSSHATSLESSSTYSELPKSTTSSRRKAKRTSKRAEHFPNKTKQETKHASKHDIAHLSFEDSAITNKKIRKKLERQHHTCCNCNQEKMHNVIECTNNDDDDDLYLTSKEVQELFASQHHRQRRSKTNSNVKHEKNWLSCEESSTLNQDCSERNANSHYRNSSNSSLENNTCESNRISNSVTGYNNNNNYNNATDNSRSDELAQFFISPVHQCVAQASSPWSSNEWNSGNQHGRYQFIGYGGLPGCASSAELSTETSHEEESTLCNKMTNTNEYNMPLCHDDNNEEHGENENDLCSSPSDAKKYTATTTSPNNVENKKKSKYPVNREADSVHEYNRERKKACRNDRDHNDIIGEIEVSWEGNSWSSGTDSFELPSNKSRKIRKRRRRENEYVDVENYLESPRGRQCVRKDKFVNVECGGSKVLAPHPAPPILLPHTSLPCSTLTLHEEIIPVSLELTSLSLGDSNGVDDVHFIFETEAIPKLPFHPQY